MRILVWLLPSFGVTVLAMVWAWAAGRERAPSREDDEAATRRLGQALARPLPARVSARPPAGRAIDRPSGIAVRPSQRSGNGTLGRR